MAKVGVGTRLTARRQVCWAKILSVSSSKNNGNMQTKVVGSNATSFAWDFENRMTTVTLPGSGGTVSFKYNPFGRRIYKSSSSTTSVYGYDGNNLVEETNATGAVVARYEQTQNIDEPLAMLRSAATSYYHADGLGSVSSLSSSAGSIVSTYTYDSFGKLTASTGSLVNPFRYTARESDTETGLNYYRAGYYDQSVGRFLSEDPLRFGAGANFYACVHNNSTTLRDWLGLCPAVCPDYIRNFFDTLMPVFRDMADETGTDARYFAALSAYESGWLGQHAQDLHNPFGLTNAGGNERERGDQEPLGQSLRTKLRTRLTRELLAGAPGFAAFAGVAGGCAIGGVTAATATPSTRP